MPGTLVAHSPVWPSSAVGGVITVSGRRRSCGAQQGVRHEEGRRGLRGGLHQVVLRQQSQQVPTLRVRGLRRQRQPVRHGGQMPVAVRAFPEGELGTRAAAEQATLTAAAVLGRCDSLKWLHWS
ncbi:unnamed protein product, partial [Ixodes hexagonus]